MIPNFAASVPPKVYSSVSPVSVSVAVIAAPMSDAVVTVASPIVSLNSGGRVRAIVEGRRTVLRQGLRGQHKERGGGREKPGGQTARREGADAHTTRLAPAGPLPGVGSGRRAAVGAPPHLETRSPEDAGQAASRRTAVRAGGRQMPPAKLKRTPGRSLRSGETGSPAPATLQRAHAHARRHHAGTKPSTSHCAVDAATRRPPVC